MSPVERIQFRPLLDKLLEDPASLGIVLASCRPATSSEMTLAWPRLYFVDAGYPLQMSSTESDDSQVDAGLAALVGRCVDLIQGEEPQGLHLLRQLREVFTDLYAALIKLPGLGIYPARTSRVRPTDSHEREESGIRNQLIQRLPSELYWSALRPLTWETVADTGVQVIADALLDLRRQMLLDARPIPPSLLRDEVPELGGPILAVLTILQEVVSDLEAYGKD